MASPVNASRLSSRVTAHHSGPRQLAKPYLVEDFHPLSFASLSWRTPVRVDSSILGLANIGAAYKDAMVLKPTFLLYSACPDLLHLIIRQALLNLKSLVT